MNEKRLNIVVPLELHTFIKEQAARRNITMRLWLTRLIVKAIKEKDLIDKLSKK